MKKKFALLLAALLLIGTLAGCGTNAENTAPAEAPEAAVGEAPEAGTEAAPAQTAVVSENAYSPDGSVIFEQDGVKVTTAGLDLNPTYYDTKPIVWVDMENTGDRDIWLGVSGISVNGITTNILVNDYEEDGAYSEDFGATVPAGGTIRCSLGYDMIDVPGIRMDTLGEMELCFTLAEEEWDMPYFTSDPVIIATGAGYEPVDITALGTVVIDNETMTLVLGAQDYDEWFGPEVYVYIANHSDRFIGVFPESSVTDGVSCDYLFGGFRAAPGKVVAGMLCFDGEASQLKGFEDLTIVFCMNEADSFDELYTADTVSLEPVSAHYDPQVWGEYENGGLSLEIQPRYNDLITVATPENDENGILFAVSETASLQAGGYDGAGWLFSIAKVGADRLHELLCYDMSGVDVFAQDADGNYYLYCHPTDVRYERATAEEMERDQEQWAELCEWADGISYTFMEKNGLEYASYGNSAVDMYLARAAWDDSANFTLSTTEYGPVDAAGTDGTPYAGFILQGGFWENEYDETPDGEYVSLSFPDEDVRLDFFFAPGCYVRFVSGDTETLYQSVWYDDNVSYAEAMQGWYYAAAERAGLRPADDSLAAYYGAWYGYAAGGGEIDIEWCVAPGKANIHVSIPESESVVDEWDLVAMLDDDGALVYEAGEKAVTEYEEDGSEWILDMSWDESGRFTLDGEGQLIWHDNNAAGGGDSVFTK